MSVKRKERFIAMSRVNAMLPGCLHLPAAIICMAIFGASLYWRPGHNPVLNPPSLYQSLLTGVEDSMDEGVEPGLVMAIQQRSKIEYKSFSISETVFPVEQKAKLLSYVKDQLYRNGFDYEQVFRVSSMIDAMPESSTVMSVENGAGASLKNTAVAAAIGVRDGKIHFTMVATVVEPHLGWFGKISFKQRNEWNRAISMLVQSRIRDHASRLVLKEKHRELQQKQQQELPTK